MAEDWRVGNTKWKRREKKNRTAALKAEEEGENERGEGWVRMRRGLGTDEDTERRGREEVEIEEGPKGGERMRKGEKNGVIVEEKEEEVEQEVLVVKEE